MLTLLVPASPGIVCPASSDPSELASAFISALEGQILLAGDFLCLPEGMPLRDRLASVIGEAQDAFSDDGEALRDDIDSGELLASLQDALGLFAPPGHYFGVESGNGTPWGFFPVPEL